jgi:hypothetical protein
MRRAMSVCVRACVTVAVAQVSLLSLFPAANDAALTITPASFEVDVRLTMHDSAAALAAAASIASTSATNWSAILGVPVEEVTLPMVYEEHLDAPSPPPPSTPPRTPLEPLVRTLPADAPPPSSSGSSLAEVTHQRSQAGAGGGGRGLGLTVAIVLCVALGVAIAVVLVLNIRHARSKQTEGRVAARDAHTEVRFV